MPCATAPITKADFFRLGLSGTQDSAKRRQMLQQALGLPSHLSANALLQVLNAILDLPALEAACKNIFSNFAEKA